MLGWILYLRKITAELIEGGNSQNADFVTTIEPVSPAKGHLVGHDFFRYPSVVNPPKSGMRNRSMSPTTSFSGTASIVEPVFGVERAPLALLRFIFHRIRQ